MAKRKFKRRAGTQEDMQLQITSMADIFTILLVFLLKTFSTGITNLSPSANVTLPEAKPNDEVVEALRVEISPTAILIEDKPVVAFAKEFELNPKDLDAKGFPKPVTLALIAEKNKGLRKPSSEAPLLLGPDGQPLDAEAQEKVRQEKLAAMSRLTVMADQNTPYELVRVVLATASAAGFSDFKLVVVEDR